MRCPTCRGTGKFPFSTTVCPVCKGKAKLPDTRLHHDDCPVCGGSGKWPLSTDICEVCSGWGKSPDSSEDGGPISFLFIESGKPRTAHLEIAELLATLSGEVRVCDPYYGAGTLLRLDLLTRCSKVMFLTKHPDSKEKNYADRAVREFVKEHQNFEVRKSVTSHLHDRYLLTDNEVIILGHGLKDIGNKQSFVIRLDKTLCGDLLDAIRTAFDNEWANGTPIS